jgi:hypothetical protein
VARSLRKMNLRGKTDDLKSVLMKKIFFTVLTLSGTGALLAQLTSSQFKSQISGQTLNPITTAVPFLLIGPDSKQGALADCGAATDPDINSLHWNGSKLAFADKQFGAGFTVTPWLRKLVPDINLYYLSGYGRLNSRQTVGASLRYFSLGTIEFTDINGTNYGSYRPNEFAMDLAFSQKLSKNFSLGVATRFINSTINKYVSSNGQQGNAASTFAVDLSAFYRSNSFKMGGKNMSAQSGFAITNMGDKIRYSNDQNFIPTNLRLGGGLKTEIDDFNKFNVYLDFNKLLVPTPPDYKVDAKGNILINSATGEKEIAAGKNPNVPVIEGMLQSFGDAPGGLKEEMREVNTSIGVEYDYNDIFAVRGGYFHEHKTKGGRQYFTVGVGFKFKVITVDGSYLIPTQLQNPLQQTWRITLSFQFDKYVAPEPEKPQP